MNILWYVIHENTFYKYALSSMVIDQIYTLYWHDVLTKVIIIKDFATKSKVKKWTWRFFVSIYTGYHKIGTLKCREEFLLNCYPR